jgi:hypothetical protein
LNPTPLFNAFRKNPMMRAPAYAPLFLALFVAGCSSSSTPEASVDAGNDVAVHKTHDAGKPVLKDAGHDARTVCEPVVTHDAGVEASVSDAAIDAPADTAPPNGDAGPISCTLDTQCPTGDICNTKSSGEGAGTCVANVGATFCSNAPDTDAGSAGGQPGSCSVNAADMCCSATAGCIPKPAAPAVGGGACCPGATGDTYCQTQLSDDHATCGAAGVCTTCMDTCISANPVAYQKFIAYQVADCGCEANASCYEACHTSTTSDPTSACGMCLTAQSTEGLGSTCTLAAAADCSDDPNCTAYQACAGACPM